MFSGFVMGRRKNEVWGSFNEVRVDGVLRAKCKKCKETVVNNPERLKSHLIKCTADGQPQAKKMVQTIECKIGKFVIIF